MIGYGDFKAPANEYRDIPFWSWNCRVTRELIDEDLDSFLAMGAGGVCIHPRAGLDVEYLGKTFMELVRYAVDGCARRGLICWLYDDDRFPSGAAAGMVTRLHPEYKGKYLLMSEEMRPGFIAAWSLGFEGGELISHRRLTGEAEIELAMEKRDEDHRVRFGCLTELPDEPWFEGSAYIDTTDPGAVDEFIRLTHERYREWLPLGGAVRAIFTDEPRMDPRLRGGLQIRDPLTHGDFAVPYTPPFARAFLEKYGYDPLDTVPRLVWSVPEHGAPEDRRKYREVMSECFVSAYLNKIGAWCAGHGLLFTGHILGEDSLASQTCTVGEAMRCYREMDIPGLDVLVDEQTWLAAVQAASVSEQMGKTGVMSELYGATDWDCPFLTYKLQGDWQAALGVTYRVPHLAHMSLEGEAKRDWPASIFTQSPWWRWYKLIGDHFARLNMILRRGKRVTRVAILHPVETVWEKPLCADMATESNKFDALIKKLLTGLIDVQLISQSLLRSGRVSAEGFDVVLRPQEAELSRLERYRDVSVTCQTPGVRPELLYQLRQDGDTRWLFLCHTRNNSHDVREDNEVTVNGEYAVRLWDTWSGEIRDVSARIDGGRTRFMWRAYRDESAVFELRAGGAPIPEREAERKAACAVQTLLLSARLTEPNAFILDYAGFSLDGGDRSERMEILKLDNRIRAVLGLPPRREDMRQPWAMEPGEEHRLTLYYSFTSATALDGLRLVVERPEEQEISLNGVPAGPAEGYFIDRALRTVTLPAIRAGENTLTVRRRFTEKTNLEPMFLTGDFRALDGVLTPPRPVTVGALKDQGLPHYTGNVEYTFKFRLDAPGECALRVPSFAAPLVDALVDGGDPVPVLTTRPVALGFFAKGEHTLTLTVYGSRYNLLSALHNADPGHYWHSPDSWRTEGEDWTDSYMVKPTGLLGPVEITRF